MLLNHRLNAEYECRAILERMAYTGAEAHNGPMEAAADYYIRTFSLDAEQARMFEPLCEVYRFVAENTAVTPQQLQTWFARLSEDNTAAGTLLYTELRIRGVPEENKKTGIWNALLDYSSSAFAGGECSARPQSYEEFAACVDALSLADEAKWRIARLGADYDGALAEVRQILASAVACFEKKRALLDPIVQQFCTGMEEKLNTRGMAGLLRDAGLDLDTPDEYTVWPSAMVFSGLALLNTLDAGTGAPLPGEMYYGVLFDWFSERSRSRQNGWHHLQGQLHAIDDKNRLAILEALHEKKLGGQDIIALTGLSPATVSHHMAELLQAELVSVEKQGTSVCYSLRREGIETMLELLRQHLL